MKFNRVFFGAAAFAACASSGNALAQSETLREGLQGIGVGVVASTQPYLGIDEDTRVNVIPAIAYDRGRIWVSGKQAGLILTDPDSEGPWEISAILDYRFEGYEANDSLALTGMADRDGTLEAGGIVTYDMGEVRLLVQGRADVLSTHGGFDLKGQAEYDWQPAPYTSVRTYAGLLFRSSDLANYYYGVENDEALATAFLVDSDPFIREAYAPEESMSPYVGVFARQALNQNLVVSVFVQHEFLPSEITDSPIIKDDGQTSFGIILAKPFLN